MRVWAGLAASAAVLFAGAGHAAPAVELRDGALQIDGRAYADLDGEITGYSLDRKTGAVGYFVQAGSDGPRSREIARSVDASGRQGEDLGVLHIDAENAVIAFAPAKAPDRRIDADQIYPCPAYVVLARPKLVARVGADGQAVRQSVPADWTVAPFQLGDVCTTDFVLLRQPKTGGGLRGLLSSVTRENYSYALLRIADGKQVPVPLAPLLARDPAKDGPESVYYERAMRGRIDWRWHDGRAFLTYLGPGLSQANVVDLESGKTAVAFSRALGLSGLQFADGPGGKLGVEAEHGFSRKTVPDLAAWLDGQP